MAKKVLLTDILSKINSDQKTIANTISIADNFYKFFTELGSKLANEISPFLASFNTSPSKCNNIHKENLFNYKYTKKLFLSINSTTRSLNIVAGWSKYYFHFKTYKI